VITSNIGPAIAERRKELGLSQQALAERARMTQPQLSRIERGATLPTVPILYRITVALDATMHLNIDDACELRFTPHPGEKANAA
jgi:transcriptional regulator with XRE-family HTH domain